MLALLVALQLAVTPVPVAAQDAPGGPQTAYQAPPQTSVTAEIPPSTYGVLMGAIALGWGLVRLGESAIRARAEKRRRRSDPPPGTSAAGPAPMPGGLPTAACETFHQEILRLGPRLEALTSASERNTEAVGALTTRLDRYISFQEGVEAARTGQHRKVGT